jgi:DNA-binding transcriptional LysR family regulator
MNDLRSLEVFAETVSAGSMTAAAQRLGMTPSAVSQTIRALERQTGVTLLLRSTRKLSLTEAGERCYPYCRQMLEAGHGATASLEHARDAPAGELRIAAPVGFGAHVAPALAPVLAEWPQVRLRLIVDDALIDLIDARIDIAVRVGQLADSGWIARKLGDMEMILCASPAYLERHGIAGTPSDLEHHDWLALSRDTPEKASSGAGSGEDALPTLSLALTDRLGRKEAITCPVRISTTNQIALQQMCEEGMGVAGLFHVDVRRALERGSLMRVLPHWFLPSRPVTMLTPRRDGEAAKVRVALAAQQRHFSSLTGVSSAKPDESTVKG